MVSKSLRFLILAALLSVVAYFAYGADGYRIDKLYHFLGICMGACGVVYLMLALISNRPVFWVLAGIVMSIGMFFYGAFAGVALLSAAGVALLLFIFYKGME